MPLAPGSRLGAYEIGLPIGAGGMGEVYRATDSKLKRAVAIKVLPEGLAADPERLARFQREAELLAALNHPHIAAVYGLEETNRIKALVMELVEGPTLADVIARHPAGLPVADAVAMARQMAEALEAAHEQGIIHRDLKPANIKIKEDGTVKVLDFGLAKALAASPPTSTIVDSPTITSPAMTGVGVILGTAAYMSPEQARGRIVDKRADIWAFGAVLYEMLSGRRAFAGEDVALTLAAVMKSEPDFSALPVGLPVTVRLCLARCLHKDPKQRLRDIGDVRLVLEGAFETAGSTAPLSAAAPRAGWRGRPLSAAAVLMAAALVGVAVWNEAPSNPRPVVRFAHPLASGERLRGGNRPLIAASPDGQRFLYNASGGIYVHDLNEQEDRRLVPSSLVVGNPVFSPDGSAIAYYEGGQIKRTTLTGGASVVLATTTNPFGMSWAVDDNIYYATPDGISRVPAQGGTPQLLVPADGAGGGQLSTPQLLPDGDTLLFTRHTPGAFARAGSPLVGTVVMSQSLRTGQSTVLVEGGANARYVPTGHLIYTIDDGLFAMRFDPTTQSTHGGATALGERLRLEITAGGIGLASYDVSRDGTLVYLPAEGNLSGDPLVWVTREGRVQVIDAIAPNLFSRPRLSADGRRVMVVAQGDLRIYELDSGRETRVTSDRSVANYTAWVPGDRAVAYTSSRRGPPGIVNVWLQRLDASRPAQPITSLEGQVHLDAWSPEGQLVAVHHHAPKTTAIDLLTVSVSGEEALAPQPFAAGPATEEGAVFSPDGRYLAYIDFVSGQGELVIRPLAGTGAATPVSVGGAREAAWAKNGELFYRRPSDDMMIAVRVTTAPVVTVGRPVALFRGPGTPGGSTGATYDVTADGQRFVMSAARIAADALGRAAVRPSVSVVLNWTEELKQRVPRTR